MKIQTGTDIRQTLVIEKNDPGKAAGIGEMDGKAAAAMMEKSDHLNSGITLLEEYSKAEEAKQAEAAKQKAEADKKTDKNTTEDTDDHSSKDLASFSRLSRLLTKDKAYLWKLEMEMELWESLLKWGPFGSDDDARVRLEELSRTYQLLLKAIMENTQGDNRALQLARLNQGLSEALNRLKDSSLNELFAFLDQCPDGKAAADLRTSLYYHVTGRTLSAKEARMFWNAGEQGRAGTDSDGRFTDGRGLSGGRLSGSRSRAKSGPGPSGGSAESAGSRAQGMGKNGLAGNGLSGNDLANTLSAQGGKYSQGVNGNRLYGNPAAGNGRGTKPGNGYGNGMGENTSNGPGGAASRGRSAYLSSMGSSEEAALMTVNRGNSAGISGNGRGKASYSIEDMQKTEDFARYLDRNGNLLQNRELTAHNEELLGCLCADLQMKGQLFADGFRLGSRMQTSVRSAIDNMIDCYLKQTEHRMQAQQDHYPLSRNDVYKVYYYVLKQCQRFPDPRQAISEGLLYASVLFDEKKSGDKARAERYSKEAGFFGAYSAGEEERTKRRRGKKLFSDSWDQFKDLAAQYGMGFEALLQTSPWGLNLSPEAVRGKNHAGKMIGGLVLTAAGVGAVLLFHYLAQG